MRVEDWGLIDYESSVERQLGAVEQVSEGAEELLVLCTHPPVVTLGRATVIDEDITGWQGSTVESSRGGRATYHGPNQLVIYPIVALKREHHRWPARDIHAYLRALEGATVNVLREAGLVNAEARTTQRDEISLTGVWVDDSKVASIGIAVRKWVSYHGVAINVLNDPTAFRGIRPCGFEASVMTSVEAELKRSVEMSAFAALTTRIFLSALA